MYLKYMGISSLRLLLVEPDRHIRGGIVAPHQQRDIAPLANLLEDFVDHGRLEQRTQERMSPQRLRRADLGMMADQAGIGEVAFGFGGDALVFL